MKWVFIRCHFYGFNHGLPFHLCNKASTQQCVQTIKAMLQYVTYCMFHIKTTLYLFYVRIHQNYNPCWSLSGALTRTFVPFVLFTLGTPSWWQWSNEGLYMGARCWNNLQTWFIESSWPVENTTLADNNDFTSASFVYPKLSIVNISRLAENIPRKTNFISIWLQLFVWLLPI